MSFFNIIKKKKMLKNTLLKQNKDIKSQANESVKKENFISEKLNELSDSKEFESIDIEINQ